VSDHPADDRQSVPLTGRKVLSVASELYPFVKTGGLADVTGALPVALAGLGLWVTTLVPGYPAVMAALQRPKEMLRLDDLFGGPARLLAGRASGLELLVIDAPHLYGREGNPYSGPDGEAWPDNAMRFGALAWMAARIGLGDAPGFHPAIIHAHDWQAALAFAYLAYEDRPRPGTVITVHNLAYQGQFPASLLSALRLPPRAFAIDGVEYYGDIGFLKAGLQFADRITTVSPTYAREIQTPAEGCGLDALLRSRESVLHGILNGIDVEVWDPATDPRIAARYDAASVADRAANKRALQQRFGLPDDPQRLLLAAVTRLTWQKGIDVLAEVVPMVREIGAQLALLGTGDRALEQQFGDIAAQYPDTVRVIIGYDEDLAHLIQAGTDALLVPSRFEPCGLTQLCALRYGAVPVVARVGGLADTIVDLDDKGRGAPTGVQFGPVTSPELAGALRRSAALWRDCAAWAAVQGNGMAVDVSWARSAQLYASLYAGLLATKE
jgi:starch synthase